MDAHPKTSTSRALERRLLEAAIGLVDTPADGLDDALHATLADIGAQLDVDRITVIRYDWELLTATATHEWCAPGVTPVADGLQGIPTSSWPEEAARHRRGGATYLPDVRDLPEGTFRRLLLEGGTLSLMDLPLMRGSECLGFVAFETVGRVTSWSAEHREVLLRLADLLRNLELRRRYEAAARRVDRLTAANHELVHFAGVVAHDLKAPLTTIGGLIETVLAGRVGPEQATQLLQRSLHGVGRMRTLIDQLLVYASAGRVIGEPATVALDAVVLAAVDRVEQLLAARGGRVCVGPLPAVAGDHERLVEVVQNLVANAVLHAPQGDAPRIWITAATLDGDVEVVVHDDGPGILPEDRERVLAPFERGALAALTPGSGLGLPIVISIVQAHGGSVRLGRGPAGGLAVYLHLPRAV